MENNLKVQVSAVACKYGANRLEILDSKILDFRQPEKEKEVTGSVLGEDDLIV